MANFIIPPNDEIKYRNAASPWSNDPVNLDFCKRMHAAEQALQYEVYLPCIKFVGCDCTWVFYTRQERDECLNEIISNNSVKKEV